MNTQSSFDGGQPSLVQYVDRICDEFREAWTQGQSPQIEASLAATANDFLRKILLRQLLAIEFAARWGNEEPIELDEYQQRFPDNAELVASAWDAFHSDVEIADTLDWTLASTLAVDKVSADEQFPGGHYFGRYELREHLGRGGFGSVYRAYDPQLDREVALKFPRADVLGDPPDTERFFHEARATAQLHHRHIVPVRDAGAVDGVLYIANDYVPATTLRSYVRRNGPHSPSEVARLVQKIALAVHFAHQQGIIHRDLKPENILVDEAGEPHVMDFGLAIRESEQREIEAGLHGTPAYMSPEQAAGRGEPVDARSDVWSLGVILYELLAGRRPFHGRMSKVLQAIQDQPPAPVAAVRPGVPRDLDAVCQRTLAKSPDDRYPSCRHLADDLQNWLEHRPVTARKVNPVHRLGLWTWRQPIAALLVMGLLIATATVAALIVQSRVNDERRRAAAIQEDARRQAVEVRRRQEAERRRVADLLEDARRQAAEAQAREKRKQEEADRARAELARSYANDAEMARRSGQWQTVLDKAEQAIQLGYSDEIELRIKMIEALRGMNDSQRVKAAIQMLAARENLGAHRGAALLWEAEVAFLDGLDDKALDLLSQAQAAGISPADEQFVAGLLATTGPEAAECFKRALKLDPYHHRALSLHCIELFVLGRMKELLNWSHVARGRYPDDPTFAYFQLVHHATQGDPDSADALLNSVRDTVPPKLIADLELTVNAIDLIRPAIRGTSAPPTLGELMPLLGKMLAAVDREQPLNAHGALRFPHRLRKILNGFVQSMPLYLLGRRKGLLDTMELAVGTYPEGTFMMYYGLVLRYDGQLREAETRFLQAADAPAMFQGVAERSLLLAALTANDLAELNDGDPGCYQRAVQHLRRRMALGPLSPEATQQAYLLPYNAGDYLLARQLAESYLAAHPDDVEMRKFLVLVHFKEENFIRVLEETAHFLTEFPEDDSVKKLRDKALGRLRELGENTASDAADN